MTDATVTDWLLDADPALRWQVERDLVGAPEATWQATRARVAREGWGAQLLALQDDDGQWAGGAYFPTRHDERAHDPVPNPDGERRQPWTATTWALKDLREWGVEAAALGDTTDRLARSSRWEYDDLPYWGGEVDACINGYTLATGTWLGADVSGIEQWFVDHQLADGGWNCEWVEGATVSSVHSTLNAVQGLLYREEHGGDAVADPGALRELRHRGEEYLLARGLMRRRSTGELIDECVTTFTHPFRWEYSALRAADHLRRAALVEGTAPDERMGAAVEVIRAQRGDDGRWRQPQTRPGLVWFETDVRAGEPSRWITLTAQRVLDWWDAAHP